MRRRVVLKETSPGSLGGRLDYSSASCPLVARSTLQKAAFRMLVQTRGAGAVARAVTPGIDSFARDATGLLNSYVGSRAGTSGEREFKVEMEAPAVFVGPGCDAVMLRELVLWPSVRSPWQVSHF